MFVAARVDALLYEKHLVLLFWVDRMEIGLSFDVENDANEFEIERFGRERA
jgi:hypothetical protein